ncbi:MAG: AbrB/MazE/SpoVT family DNA-binding domain-containing protein [Lachnospira sp.]|jgi:AbrB family looped-hinge helix DNA binding protein|nr:AbrB/MazE/SpoVT family DNA-binding domain-containing protein [Lachnospira sp.]
MEITKLSDKGQITLPISIRKKLQLKAGDKVVILEENGRFYMENSALMAFSKVANDFKGAAIEAGFNSEDEMQDYMQEIRKEVRGY